MTVALLVLTCQAAVLLKMMVHGYVEEHHQKSRELAKLDFVLLAYFQLLCTLCLSARTAATTKQQAEPSNTS